MTFYEFVLNLECRRVHQGEEKLLNQLQDFACGDRDDFRTAVSEQMLDRLKRYIIDEVDKIDFHDLYYVVLYKSTVLAFFSLQTGQVFNKDRLNPQDVAKLNFLADKSQNDVGDVDPQTFQAMVQDGDFDFDSQDDMAVAYVLARLQEINKLQKEEKQRHLYVTSTYPCIELVNFCKNYEADEIWKSYGAKSTVGAAIFWMKIVPIIENVCEIIGCEYVSLFAADKSTPGEKEKLVAYYSGVLGFQQPENLNAIKPRYDWECVFLCQKIKNLIEGKNRFISLCFDVSDDDV